MTDTERQESAPPQLEGAAAEQEPTLGDRMFRPKFTSNLLLWFILAFFLFFIIWAALTEVDQTVRADGRIIASSELQIVSNLEGGIIDAVLVEVGDEVDQGAPLIRLDQTLLGAEFQSSQAQLDVLNVKIARLEAEVAGRQPRFPQPSGPAMAEQIDIERALFRSRMADMRSALQSFRAREQQARRAVAEADASLDARRAAARAASAELDIIRPLVERGIEPRMSLVQAENRAAAAASEVQLAAAAANRARAGVTEAAANLAQARQEWRSRSAQELADRQAERAALRQTVPALEDRVRRTVIRAPLAGRVNRILTMTVGSVVRPGEPIVEIVPSEDRLVVAARVRPQDIGQVRIDQAADVGITAYESVVYGTLDGRVATISPDTVTDERTGESFYTVRIVTDGVLSDRNGDPLPVGPGMTTNVSLLGDKQSVLDYILTPITRIGRSALRE